ncbi:hypothetical protein [Streptomyces sp. NPDC048419]|uniref:hypothetical protein n=1 Tax=Streptomyces sp. NPDC048419 TaxID=3365547 RepID=UPI003710312B
MEELVLQLSSSGLSVPDALGCGPHGADGYAVLGGRSGAVAKTRATCDLLWSAQATQFAAEVVGCGDDQGFELVDGRGEGVHVALLGDRQHAHGFALSAGAGLEGVLESQGLASCTDGVEHVHVAAAADRWAFGAPELDDAFACVFEEGGEAGAVAAGASSARPRRPGTCQQAESRRRR